MKIRCVRKQAKWKPFLEEVILNEDKLYVSDERQEPLFSLTLNNKGKRFGFCRVRK